MSPSELNTAATTLTMRGHPPLFVATLIAYLTAIAGVVIAVDGWIDNEPLAPASAGILVFLAGVGGLIATRLWHKAHFRRQALAAGLSEAQAAEIWKTADEDAQD